MIEAERNEVFLALSLPPLDWGVEPPISFEDLKELLRLNLTPKDYRACQALFLLYDLENARALWLKNPMSLSGDFGEEALKTHLVDQEGFPSFVASFLETYPNKEERLAHFDELLRDYFVYLGLSPYAFIRWWGGLSRKTREIFTSFRSKEKWDEEDDDYFLTLESLWNDPHLKASELAEQVNHLLFDEVGKQLGEDPFGLERVFGYIIQFYLISLSLEKVHQ